MKRKKLMKYFSILITIILISTYISCGSSINPKSSLPHFKDNNFYVTSKSVPYLQGEINGTIICNELGRQYWFQVCDDGAGGFIIVWQDNRSGNWDIYAQRVNSTSGEPVWENNGTIICNAPYTQNRPVICVDEVGGAIISWRDERNEVKTHTDIYAQRVNITNGEVFWGNGTSGDKNGTIICNAAGYEQSHTICSDGVNGVIIVWQDDRGVGWNLYAQRINSSGYTLWGDNGTNICDSPGYIAVPNICNDGIGSAIITWEEKRNDDYDIYAQRVNISTGQVYWNVNGYKNGSVICNSSLDQRYPEIRSDGSGNVIFAWNDNRSGHWDIYAQKVNTTSGVSFWGENGDRNGTIVCNSIDTQRWPDIVIDEDGNAIIIWKDSRDTHLSTWCDIYAQKVNISTGEIYWGNGTSGDKNGTVICNRGGCSKSKSIGSQLSYKKNNCAIIVWDDSRGGVWAQKINISTGEIYWGDGTLGDKNGTVICNYIGQSGSQISIDSLGTAIVVWEDFRNLAQTERDIYALLLKDDNEGPVINEILQDPLNPGNLDFVNITVNITENQEVDIVLITTNHTGVFTDYEMGLLSGNSRNGIWNYIIPQSAANSYINYSIWVNDTSNYTDFSIQYQYFVIDKEEPSIGSPFQDPLVPNDYESVNITARLQDNIAIDMVFITSNHSGTYIDYEMDFLSGTTQDGYWNYTIPPSPERTYIRYSIWANDTSNNNKTGGLRQYQVSDAIPISNHPVDIITLRSGSENISWVITDDSTISEWYYVFVNDTIDHYYLWEFGTWNNNTPFNVPINRSIPGIFNYTIYYFDDFNQAGIPDSVFVTVVDNYPTSNQPDNITTNLCGTEEINWILYDDIGPSHYRLWVNDSNDNYYLLEDWTNWINNTPFSIQINRSSPGIYNYTIEFNDTCDQISTDTVFVTILDQVPTTNEPADISTTIFSSDAIYWRIFDDTDSGYYRIWVNDSYTHYYVWVNWVEWTNDTFLIIPINRTATGFFNYTIEYNTTTGQIATDSVFVTITSLIIDYPPTSNHPQNIVTPGGSSDTIDWILYDDNSSSYYRVWTNDTNDNYYIWIDWTTWTDGVSINVPINSTALGFYNYSIEYNDSNNQFGVPDTVFVTIVDSIPTCNYPGDISTNTTGTETIQWILYDDFGPGQYRVWLNGVIYHDWTPWFNNSPIIVGINRNSAGIFNYTIEFNSSTGQFAQDTILVTIVDLPLPPQESPNLIIVPQGGSDISSIITTPIGLGIIIGIIAIIVILLVITYVLIKKNVQQPNKAIDKKIDTKNKKKR